jgi:hypothetical protein
MSVETSTILTSKSNTPTKHHHHILTNDIKEKQLISSNNTKTATITNPDDIKAVIFIQYLFLCH